MGKKNSISQAQKDPFKVNLLWNLAFHFWGSIHMKVVIKRAEMAGSVSVQVQEEDNLHLVCSIPFFSLFLFLFIFQWRIAWYRSDWTTLIIIVQPNTSEKSDTKKTILTLDNVFLLFFILSNQLLAKITQEMDSFFLFRVLC